MTTPDAPSTVTVQQQSWREILEVSTTILTAARGSDWVEVDRLAALREIMLDAFFSQAIESVLVDSIQAGIAKLREQDEEVVRLVKNNRGLLADEITRLQVRKKQLQDYISNSG